MRELRHAVITGATGAVGNALVRELLGQGCSVTVLAHRNSRRLETLPLDDPGLSIVPADLQELSGLCLPVRADAFFHLAWVGTLGAGRDDYQLQNRNVAFALDAVALAARLGCSVFVGVGSQAEYGRVPTGEKLRGGTPCFPETGYGIAKLCAGQMTRLAAQNAGLAHVWARLLSVYGPADSPHTMVMSGLRTLLDGQTARYTAGEQQWDYLYSADAARALRLMAQKGRDGAVYPLGGGNARPLRDYILEIRDAVGPQARVELGAMPYPPRQVMYLCADIDQLTRDTGFRPKVSFREGIKKTVDWMRQHHE